MRIARFLWALASGLAAAVAVQALFVFCRLGPQDLPWTPLDLNKPVGSATGRKLAALAHDPKLCVALLRKADVRFSELPTNHSRPDCGWTEAVRLRSSRDAPRPSVPLSCPEAASIDLWMRQVVQPAAIGLLGSPVTAVEDYGSYACRRIYGRAEGSWSEHATANAIDIAGFRLGDGRRVTVGHDWRRMREGAFLHQVRDGACRLFATTLSPDYNAAHHDHLHLDQAGRGAFGWRACA